MFVNMKKLTLLFFILIFQFTVAQTVYNFEYSIGKTSPANSFFPELKPNQTIALSIGKKHFSNYQWVNELRNPETGLIFEYSNFGNNKIVGSSFSLLPYLEIPILKSVTNNLKLNTALGFSYFNKKYDAVDNWTNKAVSTDFTWAYRLFLYYSIFDNSLLETRASLVYTHHSNGHIRWPNHGLNTFLIGLNFKLNSNKTLEETKSNSFSIDHQKTTRFYEFQTGFGQQALSRNNNNNKAVYSFSAMYGKTYKNTFKVGLGFYYRFYENYYDYIKDEGYLVNEEYPELKKNTIYNSSTYGIFINGELLMNHIAAVAQIGVNIDKPFYKIDYRLNNEEYNPNTNSYDIGELDNYFWIKRFISGKLGLKYYLFNNNNLPKHNFSLGAYICSNLGQADYSELSFAYTYTIQ